MAILKTVIKILFIVAERLSSELALLAALFSFAIKGGYDERLTGGMVMIGKALFAFGLSLWKNIPFPDFMAGFSAGVQNAFTSATANIQADPQTAFIAFVGTYAIYKLAPYILKAIRKGALKGDGTGFSRGKRQDHGKGRTYEQLYEQHEPDVHRGTHPMTR
jgi:hypothetical protein